MILACEVDSVANELSFNILGKQIRFRRQEFCLVTALRFGCNMYMNELVRNMTENRFRNRMFPDIPIKVSVKLRDVMDTFNKMHDSLLVFEDNDVVKICLFVLLDYGFLGRHIRHVVTNHTLKLVGHLSNYWNIFPWGSYIWHHTYLQLRDAICKRKILHDAKRQKGEGIRYTLSGFVWAFMVASEQLQIEKDNLSEQLQKKSRKSGSSQPSLQDPTYDQLMMKITTLEGTASTLTKIVLSLQGTIGTLESRLLALEGDAHGDTRDFRVVSDGDIRVYMSPRTSYTSPEPSNSSQALTAHKSLPLANWRKLRPRHNPLRFKSPMITYTRKRTRYETLFWDILFQSNVDGGKLEGYNAPQQTWKYGILDCGVMTCKIIKMLTKGKTIDIEQFGDDVGLQCEEFSADITLMFYATRCERPV
ncbi:phospholipase-like protein [Tanacetum coccineum]